MIFDYKPYLLNLKGKQYLPVAARLIWFRQEHPDWSIITAPIEISTEKQFAIYTASIMNAEGKIIATGTKMENVKGFGDWLEKAETGAVGRALAMCGYGTQFCGVELEEVPHTEDVPEPGRQAPSTPMDFCEAKSTHDARPVTTTPKQQHIAPDAATLKAQELLNAKAAYCYEARRLGFDLDSDTTPGRFSDAKITAFLKDQCGLIASEAVTDDWLTAKEHLADYKTNRDTSPVETEPAADNNGGFFDPFASDAKTAPDTSDIAGGGAN